MNHSKPFMKISIAIAVMALTPGAVGTVAEARASDETQTAQQLIAEKDESPHLMAMNAAGEADRRELQELLAVLEEETKVATKTKMNNDYVPGMVTVLHGERLEALGVRTAAEALSLVPGIQVARLKVGEPTVKVRGIAFPFNAGNVQVMLNAIPLSRESSGINSSVLLTPVAQIERIEVIRGPGSSIYGDFAMAGVVNIITKDTGGRLFAQGGDDESLGGGGQYTYRNEAGDFDIGLNLSAVDDRENAAALGHEPEEARYTGVFHLNYNKFSLFAEGVQRKVDHRFTPPLPPGPGPPPPASAIAPRHGSRTERSWAVEARQGIDLGSRATLDAHLSYLTNHFDADAPVTEFQGDRILAELELNWSPWSAHRLFIGASYASSTIDDATQGGPAGTTSLQVSDIRRANYAVTLQDQMALSERIDLTLGARYDDYDDVGTLFSPRFAAVYRPGEHHVIKVQYSEGFRTPTFWELYASGEADKSLDFEVLRTTELSYIFRRSRSVFRTTLYTSRIDEGIYRTAGGDYGNIAVIDSKGVELEWEEQLTEQLLCQANISYNDTRDGRYGSDEPGSPGVAPWLGNLAVILKPFPKLMIAGRWLHVGERYSPDDWMDGYDTIDMTITLAEFWKSGLTVRLGVKNILDDDIIYLTRFPNGLLEDDFPGRTWWLQISYDF